MPVNDPNILDVKIRFYNRLYRTFLLILATSSLVLISIGVHQVFVVGHKIDNNVLQTQLIIAVNQQSTLEARKANAERQEDLKNYVKCITLARFDNPELASPTVTKEQVSLALDRCAKVQ